MTSTIVLKANSKIKGVQIVSKHILLPFGTTQLRCFQPAEYLKASSIKVYLGRLYRSIPRSRHIVIMHRAILDKYTKKFIDYAKSRGSVVVYDTDDLIFAREAGDYLSFVSGVDYQSTITLYKDAMEKCDVVLVSTDRLRKIASHFHPDVRVIRNGLGQKYIESSKNVADKQKKGNKTNPVTVAYLSGSASHDRDFKLVEPSLLRLLRDHRKIKVLLVGTLNFSAEFYQYESQFEFREFVPYHRLPSLFEEIDINLIPLEVDQEFCQGKSELKFIEAGICAVPSIASPTEVHCQVIQHEDNGILVQNNQWYESILQLMENEAMRVSLGLRARNSVEKSYSPELLSKEWAHLTSEIWAQYGKEGSVGRARKLKKLKDHFDLERMRWIRRFKILIGRCVLPIRRVLGS